MSHSVTLTFKWMAEDKGGKKMVAERVMSLFSFSPVRFSGNESVPVLLCRKERNEQRGLLVGLKKRLNFKF